MRYRLSKLIPIRFTSTYRTSDPNGLNQTWRERATWWQWRDRIWAHHKTVLD